MLRLFARVYFSFLKPLSEILILGWLIKTAFSEPLIVYNVIVRLLLTEFKTDVFNRNVFVPK
jgi:hypothetical protein